MTDLSDLYADDPMRAGFSKKKAKAQEKLDKIMSTANAKAAPLQAEIAMYDKMIAAIDERNAAHPAASDAQEPGADDAPVDEALAAENQEGVELPV